MKDIFQNIKEEWMQIIGKTNRTKLVELLNNPDFDKKTYEPFYYNKPNKINTIVFHEVGMPSYFTETPCHIKFIQMLFDIRNNGIMDSGAVVSAGTLGETEYIKSIAWQGVLFITPSVITLTHWLEIITLFISTRIDKHNSTPINTLIPINLITTNNIYIALTQLLHKLYGGELAYTQENFIKNIMNNHIHFTPIANPQISISPQIDFGIRQTYIFTDGACAVHEKPRRAGYSVLLYGVVKKLIYSKSPELENLEVTNQQAEGFAILEALKYIKAYDIPNALIVTDSKFWINLITDWMHKWHKISDDFSHTISTGNKIANRELVLMIYNLWTSLSQVNPVKFSHIYSHKKLPADKFSYAYFLSIGNAIVDKYAKLGEDTHDKKIINISTLHELL